MATKSVNQFSLSSYFSHYFTLLALLFTLPE